MKHIIQIIKNASLLKKQLFCFFLVSVFPLLIINTYYFQSVRHTVMEQTDRSTQQLLLQTELSLNNSFNSVDALSLSLIFDSRISDILTDNAEVTMQEHINNRQYLQERLVNARSIHDWITAITIISDEYMVSSTTQDLDYDALLQQPWLQEFINSEVLKDYTSIYTNSYIGRYGIPVFSLLRRIDDPETGERKGTLIVEMRYSRIEELFQDMEHANSGIVLVADRNGQLIYHPDKNQVGTPCPAYSGLMESFAQNKPSIKFNEKPAILYIHEVDETDWTILNIKYTDYLLQKAYTTWSRIAWVCVILSLIVMLLASGLALYISHPIHQLVAGMKQVEDGNLDIQLPVTSNDDIGHLALGFNSMTAHLRRLIDEVYEKEQEKRQADLQALQAQINPHFLYNTLGAVRWMAVMHNADSISRILLALIRLLEFSTKRTAEFVTIADEVEHMEYYTQLLQIRYADKFSLQTEIDQHVMQCRTIRFLLQPLVENAVFHGIEAKDGPGIVKLCIHQHLDRVEFLVQDDGIGMDAETVARKAFSGVGINNVNQRLIGYFGPNSALQIESRLGFGTSVRFSIPYEEYHIQNNQEDLSCTGC